MKCINFLYIIKGLIGILFIITSSVFAKELIRINPPQSELDASYSYFFELLELALDKTANDFGPAEIIFTSSMSQGRTLFELEQGNNIDITGSGTSIEREKNLLAIRIPLLKGLLGFRMAIIHRDSQPAFININNLDELKQLVACQGAHWPDSNILENSGILVMRNISYEGMFKQVNAGRCDYFPRGVHEGAIELEARNKLYPNLVLYQNFIIYYPFPMYFFVPKKRVDLYNRVNTGLNRAIDDGSFDKHIQQHPATAHLFPLKEWINVTTIIIDNPYLPKDTPLNDLRYWIRPSINDNYKKE